MKKRAYFMLGLALFLAIAAVLVAQRFVLTPKSSKQASNANTVAVVVAKNVLAYGAIISREHLRVIAWPKNAIPEGAFTSVSDVVRKGENRVVLRRVEKDEPILRSKVSGFGGRATLSSLISDGMRAATIRVNDVNGVAGFILPGDRVDVLLTRDPEMDGKNKTRRGVNLVTDVLLQNAKVLGVDQEADDSKEKPTIAKAVTLEVKPRQAQKIILAQQVGTLSLSLRNVNSSTEFESNRVRLQDLRASEYLKKNSQKSKPGRATKRRTRDPGSSIKIIRALKPSEYKVITEPGKTVNPKSDLPLPTRAGKQPATQKAPQQTPAETPRAKDAKTTERKAGQATGKPIRLFTPSAGS